MSPARERVRVALAAFDDITDNPPKQLTENELARVITQRVDEVYSAVASLRSSVVSSTIRSKG